MTTPEDTPQTSPAATPRAGGDEVPIGKLPVGGGGAWSWGVPVRRLSSWRFSVSCASGAAISALSSAFGSAAAPA